MSSYRRKGNGDALQRLLFPYTITTTTQGYRRIVCHYCVRMNVGRTDVECLEWLAVHICVMDPAAKVRA